MVQLFCGIHHNHPRALHRTAESSHMTDVYCAIYFFYFLTSSSLCEVCCVCVYYDSFYFCKKKNSYYFYVVRIALAMCESGSHNILLVISFISIWCRQFHVRETAYTVGTFSISPPSQKKKKKVLFFFLSLQLGSLSTLSLFSLKKKKNFCFYVFATPSSQ